MKTNDFNYNLDTSRIAQRPVFPRHNSKLLRIDRKKRELSDYISMDLAKLLGPNDVLVFNDSRVFSARIHGTKSGGTAQIEILFLKHIENTKWECLIKPAKRLSEGGLIDLPENIQVKLVSKREDGICIIDASHNYDEWISFLDRQGDMPLPPYIKEPLQEKSEYQTIYARTIGSAAAPTAGLHFTEVLIQALRESGVTMEFVTLHVGLDTFQPVKVDDVTNHHMHSEFYAIDPAVSERLLTYKQEKKRIIAVGTTSVRVLESWAQTNYAKTEDWTRLFIYPGYSYKFVDSIITNFHLPKSTLVMMISAFTGKDILFEAYTHAQKHDYRFYSFGDCMWIE